MNSDALSANDLAAGYSPQRVVTRASFSVEPGRIVAIVGPNGAGKSTLLKTLLGALRPIAGSVTFGASDISGFRRQHGIGYVPEVLSLPVQWTTRSALAFAVAACLRRTDIDVGAALALGGVDFDEALTVREMSKGMRQRLSIALAFVPIPRLILLDEPEAGLDPAQRVLLRNRLVEFARGGRVVIVASHDVAGICSIADSNFLCAQGSLRPVSKQELADPNAVVRLFGGGTS